MRAGCLLVGLALAWAAPEARAQNGALRCDGVDDFAIATFAPSIFTAEMTVELWARPEAYSDFGAIASGSTGFGVFATSGSEAGFMVSPGLTESAYGGSVALGEWVHLAGTYDGTNIRVFVNGVPVGSAIKADNALVNLSDVKTCVWPDGGYFYQGAIDELRVWDHVRSDQQIRRYHDVLLEGSEEGLLVYYRFDEPSGQFVLDYSGNGRHARLGATETVGADDPARIEGVQLAVPEPGGAALAALLALAGLARSRAMPR